MQRSPETDKMILLDISIEKAELGVFESDKSFVSPEIPFGCTISFEVSVRQTCVSVIAEITAR